MYEIDVLSAGNEKCADAITMRFTRADTGGVAHVVIDAGWQDDGDKVVAMLERYGAPKVDLAIVTHPDGDHIGGMAKVFERFAVDILLMHRIDQRGGDELTGADAVQQLAEMADAQGTEVIQPEPGQTFGGVLTVLGPSDEYYKELLEEQLRAGPVAKALKLGAELREAFMPLADRLVKWLPMEEVPFDDGPGCGPRNNSSVITLLQVDGKRALFTADAGVPAINAALDYATANGLNAFVPDFVQIAHHGSRRNASTELLNRLLGPIGENRVGSAWVSVVSKTDPKHPAGRVANAYKRRGYPYFWTPDIIGSLWWASPDAPPRRDYGPAPEGPTLAEADDDA